MSTTEVTYVCVVPSVVQVFDGDLEVAAHLLEATGVIVFAALECGEQSSGVNDVCAFLRVLLW